MCSSDLTIVAQIRKRQYLERNPGPNLLPNETVTFLQAMVTCHKAAIVDSEAELAYFGQYMKQTTRQGMPPPLPRAVTQEPFGFRFSTRFGGVVGQYAYARLQQIISSGIYNVWKAWYERKYPRSWRAAVEGMRKKLWSASSRTKEDDFQIGRASCRERV